MFQAHELDRSGYVDANPEAGRFRVRRDVFTDPQILERERQRIFGKCWLYLGHRSELRRPGDFLRRRVAGQEIVFNMDRDGQIHAFFNSCPHRGAAFCKEKRGNAKGFRCFYHGWAFDDRGSLQIKAIRGDHYPPNFNHDGAYDLPRVPRLEAYRDFFFVNFDRDAMSLPDYLGQARSYLDDTADQSETRLEIVGASQEYSIRANWKLLCENSVDGYHAMPTHATYMDFMMASEGNLVDRGFAGPGIDLGNGHAVVETTGPNGRPVAQWVPRWGEQGKQEIEEVKRRLAHRLGVERAERIATMNRNILIFPNMAIVDSLSMTVRTFYPEQPGFMHVSSWALAPAEESPTYRERRITSFQEFFAPGGFGVPDDIEALEACQRGYAAARDTRWNDISRGYGKASNESDDELQMRAFWTRWNDLMTAPDEARS